MLRSLITLLLCTGLAACGLKGPLVLPDAQTHEPVARPAATTPAASSPEDTDRKRKPQ